MKRKPLILCILAAVLGSGLATVLLSSAKVSSFSQSDVNSDHHLQANNCLHVNPHQQIHAHSQTYTIKTPLLNLVKHNIPIQPMGYLDFYCRGTESLVKRDYSQAINYYTEAVKLNPNFAEAYVSRGVARGLLNNHQDAIQDYDLAKNLAKEPLILADLHNSRAISQIALGNKQDAIKDFSQAIKLEPKQTIYWKNRGSLYTDLKDFSAAITDYNVAIQSEPFNSELYTARGKIHFKKGDKASSIKDIKTAINVGLRKKKSL
jgi:tetratricopeptide (TPR) repeat protein